MHRKTVCSLENLVFYNSGWKDIVCLEDAELTYKDSTTFASVDHLPAVVSNLNSVQQLTTHVSMHASHSYTHISYHPIHTKGAMALKRVQSLIWKQLLCRNMLLSLGSE